METKTPVGHHSSFSRDFAILASNIKWGWAGHEVKINDSTDNIVLQVLAVVVVDVNIHAIAVE